MNAAEMRDFRLYLKQCSDAQVRGVYEKERAAGAGVLFQKVCRFVFMPALIAV